MTVPFKPEPWLAEWIGQQSADATRVAPQTPKLPPVPVIGPANAKPQPSVQAALDAGRGTLPRLGRALQAAQMAAEFVPGPVGDVASAGAAVREARAGNPGMAALSAAAALPFVPVSVKAAKRAEKAGLTGKEVMALRNAAKEGGFTFDPRTRSFVQSGGYMVGGVPGQKGLAAETLTPKALNEFMDNNADLLKREGMMFGGWFDEDSGKYFLDVSERIPDRDKALSLLKERGEKSAWHLDEGKLLENDDVTDAVSAGSELPAAPNIITSESGDAIPLDVSIDPPGVDASRPPIARPPRADLSVLDPLKRRVRDVYTPAAERGLRENPRGAAWYDLSPLKRIFESESPTGAEDFDKFTALLGPTSAGTDVPQNIRQASLFYQLLKQGKLTPEAIRGKQLVIPPGYGNRLNIREPLARVVEQGGLDPLKTPKTARYSAQLGGKNWGGVTLDRHVGYNIGVPGNYVGAAGSAATTPNARIAAGRGFPTAKYRESGLVDTSPENRHYAEIEDAMIREAEKLGVHPAAYQAAGWVGNADKTKVADARHPLEIINAKLHDTAKRYGYKNANAALRAFIRGETPLWALGGGLLGVSAAEQGVGGLLGEQ